MSKIKLFIHLILVVGSFFLLFKSYNIFNKTFLEIKEEQNKITCQYSLRDLKSEELITAKNVITALVKESKIPLDVEFTNDIIVIKAQNKNDILTNKDKYYKFLNLLKDFSQLPYKVQYQSFCIGELCGEGGIIISMKLQI